MSSVVRRSGRKRKSSIYNSSEYASLDEDEGPSSSFLKKNKINNSLFIETRPQCQKLLSKLMNHEYAWPFNQPVDPVALNLPDDFAKITHPMDFGTIQKKLDTDSYRSSDDFGNDVRLVFTNCWTYNLPGSDIYIMATHLSNLFEKQFKTIKSKEAKLVEDTEVDELKSVVNQLRSEHTKLLGELQKLIKESQSPAISLPPAPMFPSSIPSLPVVDTKKQHHQQQQQLPKKKAPKKARIPKTPKKKAFDLKDKEILSEKINKLSPENLQKMVEMIAQDIPEDKKKNGELEIDLETLSESTLHKLDKFVETSLRNQEEQLNNRTIPAGEEHTMNNLPTTNGTDAKKSGEESSSSDSESDSSSSSSSESESESEASDNEHKVKDQQPQAQTQPPQPQIQV